MIIISVFIHILGNHLPKWTLQKAQQNNPIIKLSGLSIDFFIAFLIIFLVQLLSPKGYYIDYKDAIYGYEFSDVMKEIGFEDGDKIVAVDHQPVGKATEITMAIVMNSIITINRDNRNIDIQIIDEDKMKILESKDIPVKVKLTPNVKGEEIKEIKRTKEKFSFIDVLKGYQINIKGAYNFINPERDYKKVSGINFSANSLKEKMGLLAFTCLIVGILNLLPLPGFSLGNFIISIIEKKRRKSFDTRKKNIIGFSTVFLVVIFILYQHF